MNKEKGRPKLDFSEIPKVALSTQQEVDKCAEIIEKIASGENIVDTVKEYCMSYNKFRWIIEDNKILKKKYYEARKIYSDYVLDQCISIADNILDTIVQDKNGSFVQCKELVLNKRLRIDTRKYEAARWQRRLFLRKSENTRGMIEEIIKEAAAGNLDFIKAKEALELFSSAQNIINALELEERVKKLEESLKK